MKTDVNLPPEDNPKDAQPEKALPPPEKKHSDPPRDPAKDLSNASPFQKAKSIAKRLKIFIWGDSGVGKTWFSLHFPNVALLDFERGSDLYASRFNFDVLKATTFDQVVEVVQWLLANKHPYRTLILDPVTVLWESLQRKWSEIFLRRNKTSKGFRFEFYDLQPKDWMTIKAELKALLRMIISLDMHVIAIARAKTQYKEGSFMVSSGDTFDMEKSMPYLFDIVLRLFVDEKGRYMATAMKDRSTQLPLGNFECNYELFEKTFGKEFLNKKADPQPLATSEQKAKILAYAQQLGLSDEYVEKRLAAYGAESIDDLTAKDATVIIQKLEATIASKQSK